MKMKKYEKPRLMALSLSGNDMLCATCDIDIIGDNGRKDIIEMLEEIFGPIENLFATGEDCKQQIDVEGYCKFTGTNVLINS